jgi:NAD dependent epimerase/dehydratase
MSRILVTGADGFIGSHLVEELVRQGRTVRAFVYYNSFDHWGWLDSAPANVKNAIQIAAGDIRDRRFVDDAVKGCTSVLHLAALIGIPYSYRASESYVDVNVHGTLNVVEAARAHGLNKVVVTSTSEVYGTAQFVPITEDHPLVGQSPYAATKIAADQLALSYQKSFGVPVAVARPFNTYGPRQSARAVIPTIISQLASGATKVKLGAVHPTRDLTFVADTARGLIAVHDNPKSVGEVINLGTGFEIAIGDLAELVAEVMGVTIELETEAARLRPAASEVERLCADVAKAGRLLDWKSQLRGREGLRQGLAATVAWFADPKNRERYRAGRYAV